MGLYVEREYDACVPWGNQHGRAGSEKGLLCMQLYKLPLLLTRSSGISGFPHRAVHCLARRLPCVLMPALCTL